MRRFYLLLTIIVTLPIYGNVTIDDGNGEIIQFADPQVKNLCVSKWDTNGDGELSKAEAAAVEGIKNDEFKGTTITSFDELKYFTSLYYVQGFTDCSNLESISLPAYCMFIYPSAFQGCTNLKTINGLNSIEVIGQYAFAQCSSIASVDLSSAKRINDGAFRDCAALSSVTFGKSLEVIERYTFNDCVALKSVIIPMSVKQIGERPFTNCQDLETIVVENGNEFYESPSGCNAIIEKSTNELICGCKNTVIPNSVVSISDGAFECCSGLTSIEIPNSVVNIGMEAFSLCSGLTSIDLPESVKVIEESAFSQSGLKSIVIPNSVKTIESYAFWGTPTESVTIGASVETIGALAFMCQQLRSLTINCSSLRSVDARAFSACVNLSEIISQEEIPHEIPTDMFPENVYTYATLIVPVGTKDKYKETSGWNKFSKIVDNNEEQNGKELTIGDTFTVDGITYKLTSSTEVQVGDGEYESPAIAKDFEGGVRINSTVTDPSSGDSYSVVAIGDYAFQRCDGITSIDIPSTITSIGEDAFWGLGITSFAIPNSVKAIAAYAFFGCSKLESITIPESVESIGRYAFCSCQALSSIHIPSSVVSIGDGAFSNCWNVTQITVDANNNKYDSRDNCNAIIEKGSNKLIAGCRTTTIPNSVEAIGSVSFYQMFNENDDFVNIEIPNSVKTIGVEAFFNNNGLMSVSIPSSVTSIGIRAFANCAHLEEVYVGHTDPLAITDAFAECQHGLQYLYVPAGSEEAYRSANGWSEFQNIVPMEAEKVELKTGDTFTVDGITYKVKSSTEVQVGGNSILESYHKDLTGSITIPSEVIGSDGNQYAVTAIGQSAFENCSGITSIAIPASIKEIGPQAFSRCENLVSVAFDSSISISEIQLRTFYGCTSLTSISIPNTVKQIGELAFYSCNSLNEIVIPNSVTEIGKSAFTLCSSLTSITIGSSVKSIGARAFNACGDLKHVYISDLAAWCGISFEIDEKNPSSDANPLWFDGKLYLNGDLITDLVIPDGVTSISDIAFVNSGITSLTIPNSVTSIGLYAFEGCGNISQVTSYISSPFAVDCFENSVLENATFNIPYGTKDIYMATDGWKDFSNIEEIGGPSEPEYYAVYDDGTLTFYYDTNLRSRTGTVYTSKNWRYMRDNGWGEHASEITKVVFDTSFANFTELEGTKNMFYGCSSLTSIVGLENLKTDKVWSMDNMFNGCTSLTTLDLSSLNTSYTRAMNLMFCDCSSLTSINLGGNFSTASATNLSFMFSGCSSLTNLDLSSFDTKNVTNMSGMFGQCSSLKSVDLSSFNTSKTTSLYNVFHGCSSLTNIDLSNFDTSNVKSMLGMFQDCSSLTSLDISSFNTSSVTDLTQMFRGCSSLATIYVGDQWNTDNISHSTSMFDACNSLVGGRGTKFDANHINASYAHIDGGTENPGYLTDINAPQDNVVLTVNSYTREYGEENPAFEYTETEGTITSGTPAITCEATKTSPVGTYDIVIAQGTVSNSSVELVKGTLTITKAPLTIAAKSYSRKQGEENPKLEVEYKGFKNNETEEILSKKPSVETRATATSEPGKYEITVSGAEAENYEITYKNGELTVTKADAIVVTAKNYTREYGEANPNFEFTSEGATLDGKPEISCEATATSPVGTYPIIIKKGSVKNYNDEYVNGILTITKAPLTIAAKSYSRKQGEENPKLEVEYKGFKNNETEAILSKKPSVETRATATSEPGKYEITVSGAEAENYEITYKNGELTVTKADAIIVTAKSYTREYGEANPNFEFTSDGAALDGTPEITCEATATSPVGTYPIVIKKGSVKNYNDEYVNGILTITKAPLKVSVKDYTITEGEELPEFELTFEGFKNNETKDVLTKLPVATTEATSSSKPGTYAIKISGGEAENYDFSYTEGAITILEAPKPDPIETESGETVQKLDDGTVAVTGNKNATDDYQIPETVVIEGVSYQVTKIEPEAFKNNTELTKVTIPATVLEIGEGAFAGCTNLTEIVIYTVTPPTTLSEVRTRATGTSIFEGVDKETCLLYVPDGSVDAYKAADGWKEFKHILPISTLGISSFSADGRSFEVYNLQGRKVRHEATSLDGLPKGVYIINGKKIVK